jgi:hypothetical protein
MNKNSSINILDIANNCQLVSAMIFDSTEIFEENQHKLEQQIVGRAFSVLNRGIRVNIPQKPANPDPQ